jgi:hypothetical protein
LGPAGRGRRQAMLMQPAVERPVRGDLGIWGNPSQFDPDAQRPPAGMLAAEIQDRPPQRRVRAGMPATVVIAGGQIGQGLLAGLGLEDASCQVANRAQRQIELPGELRKGAAI